MVKILRESNNEIKQAPLKCIIDNFKQFGTM